MGGNKVAPLINVSPVAKSEKIIENIAYPIDFLLRISQWFGFFPVQGLSGDELRFHWLSLHAVYSILTFCCGTTFTVLYLYYIIMIDGDLYKISGLVFYLCGTISCILFIRLARNWPYMMQEYKKIRRAMKGTIKDLYLMRKLKMITTIFLSIATVEHVVIQIFGLINAFTCNRTARQGFDHFFRMISYPHIFFSIQYSFWIAIICQFINMQMTFSWTFVDLFIIVTSIIFTSLLKQLENRMKTAIESQANGIETWRDIREDYTRICQIVSLVGEKICDIVILSFSTNQYSILIQLFKTMKGNSMDLERTYLYISLSLLIARICCVSLFGAAIYEENRKLIPILQGVPPSSYNKEVRRLTSEVVNNKMAINARGFFSIKRNLILQIAGAIVSYELVLVQFNSNLLVDNLYSNETCPKDSF